MTEVGEHTQLLKQRIADILRAYSADSIDVDAATREIMDAIAEDEADDLEAFKAGRA